MPVVDSVRRFVDKRISGEFRAIMVDAVKLVELVLEEETSIPVTCVRGEYSETEAKAVMIVSAPETSVVVVPVIETIPEFNSKLLDVRETPVPV